MFDEVLPSEIVPAHLPVLHDNWSSIRSLRDADFEKTGDVLLKGHTKQKGRHDFCDCFQRCRENKGIDLFWKDASASKPSPSCSPEQTEDHRHEVQRCNLVSA